MLVPHCGLYQTESDRVGLIPNLASSAMMSYFLSLRGGGGRGVSQPVCGRLPLAVTPSDESPSLI